MKTTLIVFRLYDLSYSRNGEYGNKETLRVSLGQDNVLTYSLFGGWQDSGIAFSISNLQLSRSLPLSPKFETIEDLEYEIRETLKTGVGSHTVYKAEVLNDLNVESRNAEQIKKFLKLKRYKTDYHIDDNYTLTNLLSEFLEYVGEKS